MNPFSKLNELIHTPSDINQHLVTLFKYATECESVLELGVRGCVSSWAFLCGLLKNGRNKKVLRLNDIDNVYNNVKPLVDCAKSSGVIDIGYKWINDLELNVEGQTFDLVFIDTWHIYGQLKRELDKFSKCCNKYIIMHDTEVDKIHGETIRCGLDPVKQSAESGFHVEEITKGLGPAVEEFLANNSDWKIKEVFTNNNGLTILEHV